MDRRFWVGMLKDWGIAIAVATAVFVGWNALRPQPPRSGLAPDFTLSDLDGALVTLSDLQGQLVVLNFWATWCGPCRAEIPELTAFSREHPDVVVLGISVDEGMSTKGVGAYATRLKVGYPVLHDPRGVASDPYGVSVLPTTVVVDAQGDIHATHVGALDRLSLERLVFD